MTAQLLTKLKNIINNKNGNDATLRRTFMGCGNTSIFDILRHFLPLWLMCAMMLALALGAAWYEGRSTEEFNTTAVVTGAYYAPANDWQEYYGWPWSWTNRASLEAYVTTVTCTVTGQNITLRSGRPDIYENARGKVGCPVTARIAKLNKYYAVSWIRGVDYKYALVGIE
jgi:hypothetical protein